MLKWEYKTIQAVNHKDFDDQSVLLGQEGWESLGTQNINGWVVGKFKRPAESDLGSTDTLAGLLQAFSDPKKSIELLSKLKDATKTHSDAKEQLLQANKQATEQISDAQKVRQTAAEETAEALKLRNQVQAEKTNLEAAKKVHANALDAHVASVTTHRQVMSKELSDLETAKKAHNDKVVALETAISKKEAELTKREANVSRREEAVVAKERQVSSVLDEFQGLTKKVTR